MILKEPAPEGGELVRSLTRPGLTGEAEQELEERTLGKNIKKEQWMAIWSVR